MSNYFVILLLIAIAVPLNSLELFSALVDLERLLHSEKDVAQHLRSYVVKETQRLDALLEIANSLEEHSNKALENPNKFVSNPINAFKLVRRFTSDWSSIVQDYIQASNTEDFLKRLPSVTNLFPDNEDLLGSAIALFRLIDTYALDANEVALGNILAYNNSPSLSAYECFELGKLAFDDQDYYHAVLFMNASLFVLEREKVPSIQKFHVLDYLSYALFQQGNILQAYMVTLSLLQIDPDNERLINNKAHYKDMLEEQHTQASNELKLVRPLDEYRNTEEFLNYEKLCRGEKIQKYQYEHKLQCHLKRHQPMFYISPVKEEEIYLNPRIVVYHDFITSNEMKIVKQLAFPKLNRATVQNSRTGKLETASYRVSKSAWLKDEDDLTISRISQKTSALVNLTLNNVEDLQVVNYGIGGHYEPHFDFARKEEVNAFDDVMGNRILTFICYMADIEAGGSTVFPQIVVELKPKEGSCAVWYNLFKNGDGDYNTRHAACPVLVGNKWVANKWFHERGQEFIRPCSLNPDE